MQISIVTSFYICGPECASAPLLTLEISVICIKFCEILQHKQGSICRVKYYAIMFSLANIDSF